MPSVAVDPQIGYPNRHHHPRQPGSGSWNPRPGRRPVRVAREPAAPGGAADRPKIFLTSLAERLVAPSRGAGLAPPVALVGGCPRRPLELLTGQATETRLKTDLPPSATHLPLRETAPHHRRRVRRESARSPRLTAPASGKWVARSGKPQKAQRLVRSRLERPGSAAPITATNFLRRMRLLPS
jgi:hypothetical protein